MKKALIFHGTGGSAQGNWFPWLKAELEQRGYKVAVPQFPNAETPNFEKWLDKFTEYNDYVDENSIIIGHSLGGLFLLRVLERLEHPIRAAFFVSAPVGVKPIRFYDSDLAFSGFDFNWNKIRSSARYFEVWHSDNDPYVSLANGEKLAEELGVKLNFIPNAGHLNAESGYTTLPDLLEKIEYIDKE